MTETINWNKDQPAPKQAIGVIHANFPQVRNLGIYVCRNVKGTDIKSPHSQGRALDIGLRADLPAERALGDQLFQTLIRSAFRSGIDNIIWSRQIWSRAHQQVRPFAGAYTRNGKALKDKQGRPVLKNPHTDHIHVEWTRDGSQMQRLAFLELQVSILRQGFEEISAQQSNLA